MTEKKNKLNISFQELCLHDSQTLVSTYYRDYRRKVESISSEIWPNQTFFVSEVAEYFRKALQFYNAFLISNAGCAEAWISSLGNQAESVVLCW